MSSRGTKTQLRSLLADVIGQSHPLSNALQRQMLLLAVVSWAAGAVAKPATLAALQQ